LLRTLPLMLNARSGSPGGRLVHDWAELAPILSKDARGWLQKVRQSRMAPAAITAALPVALVEPYLAGLERAGPDLFRTRAEISPLTRVWRLWRASARGKI
jgi:phytoene synthase